MPGICKKGQCINTVGSYKCQCDAGFELNPTKMMPECIGKDMQLLHFTLSNENFSLYYQKNITQEMINVPRGEEGVHALLDLLSLSSYSI